jgi:hypothetical protein
MSEEALAEFALLVPPLRLRRAPGSEPRKKSCHSHPPSAGLFLLVRLAGLTRWPQHRREQKRQVKLRLDARVIQLAAPASLFESVAAFIYPIVSVDAS